MARPLGWHLPRRRFDTDRGRRPAVGGEQRQRAIVVLAGAPGDLAQQPVKDQLKANTDEVMARGGFGSPTIFIDKTDMYFGNDRLPLVRDALARRKERAA